MTGLPSSSELDRLFPIRRRLDFFNHAGVAPISGPAAEILKEYASLAAERAYVDTGWYRRIKDVRQLAANIINAPSAETIAFIPNTSTGLAQVAKGLHWQAGDEVIITNVEYPANRYCWLDAQQREGIRVVEVEQQPDGRIPAEAVIQAITPRTRLVSISMVQYASGFRMDVEAITRAIHAQDGLICVDAIQSVGVMPVDVQALDIDFLAADGHKWMLGPEGLGFFYCRPELIERLHPNVVGWANMVNALDFGNYQFEFDQSATRFEPGTLNIPGILALGASLELLLEVGIEHVWQRVEELNAFLCKGLREQGWRIYSPREVEAERSGAVVFEPSCIMGKRELSALVQQLESQDIIIALREGRLRVSPHFYNDEAQLTRLIEALDRGD